MPETLVNLLYIISAMLFVFGLKRLSRADTARKGNMISAIGMLLAIVTALASDNLIHWPWIVVGLAAGSVIGALAARLVAMTSMPEMVALFNGFGGNRQSPGRLGGVPAPLLRRSVGFGSLE
jgi:NAD(P) transhydrogenase subunit beta